MFACTLTVQFVGGNMLWVGSYKNVMIVGISSQVMAIHSCTSSITLYLASLKTYIHGVHKTGKEELRLFASIGSIQISKA